MKTGKAVITSTKFIGTRIPAKIPKLAKGINSDNPVAKKQAVVVEDVDNYNNKRLLF